jgi:hypothetical protein
MPKYAARIDANQGEIVDALRKAGATVQHLHRVGAGCPVLMIGFRGSNLLFEVKDGDKPPSQQTIRRAQTEWRDTWRGQVAVVTNADEALAAMFSSAQEIPFRGSIM